MLSLSSANLTDAAGLRLMFKMLDREATVLPFFILLIEEAPLLLTDSLLIVLYFLAVLLDDAGLTVISDET